MLNKNILERSLKWFICRLLILQTKYFEFGTKFGNLNCLQKFCRIIV